MRTKAKSSAPLVERVPLGARVEVLGTCGSWTKVKFGSRTGFRHLCRQRGQGAVAVGGEVGAVGGIDADQWASPPRWQNESAAHVDNANGFPWKIGLSQ